MTEIINKGKIFDISLATNIIDIVYVLVFKSYNEIFLKLNYGTYEFVTLYNDFDDVLKYGKEIVTIMKYEKDYPTFDDKTVYRKHYVIDKNYNNYKNDNLELVLVNDLKEILEKNMFDNPRNRDKTKEMLEVIEYL